MSSTVAGVPVQSMAWQFIATVSVAKKRAPH